VRTIPRLFRGAVEEVADRPWLLAGDEEYTYGAAQQQVARAAAWLRAAGISRHDRVLVVAESRPETLFAWLGLMEVGAIQVPVNPSSTEAELAGLINQVDPALILVPDRRPCPRPAAMTTELFAAEPDGEAPASVDEDDVAVMIPTSGTTGRSKLVMQTHRAYVMAGEGFPVWLGLDGTDRLMTSLPLFHINAPAYSTLGSVAARASLVVLPNFSATTFIDLARRYGASEFNAIGAMLEILMRQPERADDADNPLRLCYTGPSPTRARQLEIEERYGLEIVCGYALSESPYGLIWKRGTRPYGTLGSPRQHPEMGHVNDSRVLVDGHAAVPGEAGELELRNPAIMRGYYEMPEETADVLRDGWLRTGDLVTDNGDGTYTFVGRVKQVIRRRGENLSPTEVEAVLEEHPAIAEAAVIAVPSELSEDDVKAFVMPAPGATVDLADVRRLAAARLARFKVPRYFEIVTDLPHTPTGRLAKHQLPTGRNTTEVDFEEAP
jgi:crotonobetaine/carnitine-CoA ligase